LIERSIQADVIVANLPYIASDELRTLTVSRCEPRLALDGGPDGLDWIRELLRQAPAVCRNGALILLEIGAEQGTAALELAHRMLKPRRAELLKDYAGHDRIVKVGM
jgi:release factor glutamine methyltransferase